MSKSSKDNNNTNPEVISGKLVYKQFIELDDGTERQVRYNQDPSLYAGTNTQLYSYTAKETVDGNKVEVTRYAVDVNDAVRAKRTSTKEQISALKSSGLSADEILAKLMGTV